MAIVREGIAVAGTVLVDRINEVAAYPKEGELTQIKRVSRAVGGCVPNVGIDLKRIDPNLPVYGVGAVGKDNDGDFLKRVLHENGVDTGHLKDSDLPTSFTDVMSVAGGQRTFFTYPGACAIFGYEHFDFDALPVKMLHLGYFFLLETVDKGDGLRILKEAKKRGIVTSVDMVSDSQGDCAAVKACLPYTDNLIINELEAGMLTGIEPTIKALPRMAAVIKEMGVCDRVIIHTPAIGVCCSRQGCFTLPSIALPKGFIKGTTGAGDAFCAGALLSIYRGMSELEILARAERAAVASLTAPDSIGGMRSEAEIDALIAAVQRNN